MEGSKKKCCKRSFKGRASRRARNFKLTKEPRTLKVYKFHLKGWATRSIIKRKEERGET